MSLNIIFNNWHEILLIIFSTQTHDNDKREFKFENWLTLTNKTNIYATLRD